MKRKITQIGPSTLSVSLPSKWVKKFKVKRGDELEIDDSEAELKIFSPESDRGSKYLSMDVSSYDKRLIRLSMNNAYRRGFSTLRVTFKNGEQLRQLKDISSQSVFGFEMVDEKEQSCVIENVLRTDETKYGTLYRRVFLLIFEMFESLISGMKKKRIDTNYILQSYSKIDQYINFCLRRLYGKSDNDTLLETFILQYLLMIPSTLKRMANYHTLKHMEQISAGALSMFNDIALLYRRFYEVYFKKDISSLNGLNRSLEKMMEHTLVVSMKKMKPSDAAVYMYMSHIVRFLVILVSPATMQVITEKKTTGYTPFP